MVEAFIGRFGSGKTYSMVRQAYRLVQRPGFGRVVAANFHLEGDVWGDWVLIDSVADCPRLSNALVLLDEAGIWFDNHDWRDPALKPVWHWLTQSRKHKCHIWYTAQTEKGVSAKLVRNTATFWVHERYRLLHSWFRQRGFDPQTGEKFKSTWYRFDARIGRLYNTHEIVGLANGEGRAVGAAAQELGRSVHHSEDARIITEAQRSLVRVESGGRVVYRPAWPSDVMEGAELVCPAGRRQPWTSGGCNYETWRRGLELNTESAVSGVAA